MNPILPLEEYIPDGEPHVFDGRIYLYGSHDGENGTRFCMQDYRFYSSDIHDLAHWTAPHTSYRKIDDPRSTLEKTVDFYAPDCVKGLDGKYYLYYFIAGPNTKPFGPISVAVSDAPDGPFTYLADLQYKDGTIMQDFLTNDPAVINDEGHIYLYYGWGFPMDFRNRLLRPLYHFVLSKLTKRSLKAIRTATPSILSCAFVELEQNMFTIKTQPKAVLDSLTTAKKQTALYLHPFYEAASIRKIKDTYYLIYSSGKNGELCYATSKRPDQDFSYQGVLLASNDVGYQGNTKPKAFADTNHGSIECVDGTYYVFYHRLTRNSNFSRQACVEKIQIEENGFIEQVEVTSCGAEPYLIPQGEYSACIACNYFERTHHTISSKIHCVRGSDGDYYVGAIHNHGLIGFKYFKFEKEVLLSLQVRGAEGTLRIFTDDLECEDASISLHQSKAYQEYECILSVSGIKPLYIEYIGKGTIDLKSINFKTDEHFYSTSKSTI